MEGMPTGLHLSARNVTTAHKHSPPLQTVDNSRNSNFMHLLFELLVLLVMIVLLVGFGFVFLFHISLQSLLPLRMLHQIGPTIRDSLVPVPCKHKASPLKIHQITGQIRCRTAPKWPPHRAEHPCLSMTQHSSALIQKLIKYNLGIPT